MQMAEETANPGNAATGLSTKCQADEPGRMSSGKAQRQFISLPRSFPRLLLSLLRAFSCFLRALRVQRVLAAALIIAAGASFAADYPSKSIRIVVPYPPGGFNDTLARTLAEPTAKLVRTFAAVRDQKQAG